MQESRVPFTLGDFYETKTNPQDQLLTLERMHPRTERTCSWILDTEDTNLGKETCCRLASKYCLLLVPPELVKQY
jgi:hypothetical protein